MSRPDRHNEIELNFLTSGWLTYLLGGRKVKVEAGRLSAFWAAIPHQIINFGKGTEYFVATIPLAWFLQCKLPNNCVQPLLHGQLLSDTHTARARSDCELFTDWENDLRQADAGVSKAVLLEIEARLIRFSIRCPEWKSKHALLRKQRTAISNEALSKVEQMACLIAQSYTEPITIEMIANGVRLHPNYAMALFHKAFGTTLIDYLTQHRISHAQRLLATSEIKVIDVCYASGFRSLSRFNDAFRKGCGCSPREYRKVHFLG